MGGTDLSGAGSTLKVPALLLYGTGVQAGRQARRTAGRPSGVLGDPQPKRKPAHDVGELVVLDSASGCRQRRWARWHLQLGGVPHLGLGSEV